MLEIATDEDVRSILEVKKENPNKLGSKELNKVPLIKVDKLPSQFKGYPEGTTISYSPLTLGELEALNNGEPDIERGIAMLLNSIHCNTLDAYDLYYWDVMFIGIKRKLLAFGDTHGIVYAQCPKCGEIISREFDYTEIEFKEIEAPDLPIFTNINGKDVEIGLLTMKDFLELSLDNAELEVYARMIKNLPYEEALELVSNAYGKDAKKITYIDKVLNYGMKPFIETCTNMVPNPDYNPDKKASKENVKTIKCNNQVRVEVRSPFEVVFPENTDNGSDEFEIQYGRK